MKDRVETRNDVLNFLYGRIDYERKDTPQHAQSFKLDRMRELMRRLGNPQDHLKIVHIAGTKGKGSTAHMIAAFSTLLACVTDSIHHRTWKHLKNGLSSMAIPVPLPN